MANFPGEDREHIVLVTDGGQIIRVPVADISIMSRRTQGVTVFNVGAGETVVSVTRLSEDAGGNGPNGPNGGPNGGNGGVAHDAFV